MLCERCLNVGHQRWGPTLPQHSHNVAWTLSQCQSPTLGVTLPQCSHIIGWMLSQCWPMSAKVVTTLWQHWDIGQNTTLVQCSHNVGWTSTQCCWDVQKYLQMNVATTLDRCGVRSKIGFLRLRFLCKIQNICKNQTHRRSKETSLAIYKTNVISSIRLLRLPIHPSL